MTLERILTALSRPGAYPWWTEAGLPLTTPIVVRHTHISAVFLAGPYAYKVKKPVNLGFLDFSTLEKRFHFCLEEVRLNARYSPDVYLGVVPITEKDGALSVGGDGVPVEWAVQMRRLPDEATLLARVQADENLTVEVEQIGRTIASYHAQAPRSDEIASFGRLEVVARNLRENFEQSSWQVGRSVEPEVFTRLRSLTERALSDRGGLIERRAKRGVVCDTHGDLRMEHVYLLEEGMRLLDCIEFNQRFRYADPISDLAFLAMDLDIHGRRDISAGLVQAWLDASGDDEAMQLLPLYLSYRAAVRGKVGGMQLQSEEIPLLQREAAAADARRRWLYALTVLERPHSRPCLVGVGGLPGTGKSTLARGIAREAGFEVVRSDVVRKRMLQIDELASASAAYGEGIYSATWKDRVYRECLRQASDHLVHGRRVLVDASFSQERWRGALLDTARDFGVPGVLIRCDAWADDVRDRLRARGPDASDADWEVYLHALGAWETESERVLRSMAAVDSDGGIEATLERGLAALEGFDLARPLQTVA